MLTIAAKQLGQLAMPDACHRCFWLQRHAAKLLPFQHFPGVFGTLDRLSKDAIYARMAKGAVPWLETYGRIEGHLKPPHWSKFGFTHGNLHVRGEADMILTLEAGGLYIPDLKTASLTDKQDELLPIYATQLNSYAMAAEATGMGKVKHIAVLYCQPEVADVYIGGYHMTSVVHVVEVNRDDNAIIALCDRAYDILTSPLPAPTPSCEDCTKLAGLQSILASGAVP